MNLKWMDDMKSIKAGWDSYSAEAPNEIAMNNAKLVLDHLYSSSIIPDRIIPSVEGGVAITFIRDDRYADFECFNDGEIYVGQSTKDGVNNVTRATHDDIAEKINQLWEFVRGADEH